MSSNKKQNAKVFLIGLVVGLVIASFGIGYFAYTEIAKAKAEMVSPIPENEAVQWIMERPEYAEIIKSNHDNYMKAAEQAFLENLNLEATDGGKE